MTNTDDDYTELMTRRAALTEFWMTTMLPQLKQRHGATRPSDVFATGPVLGKSGDLYLMVHEKGEQTITIYARRGEPVVVVPPERMA